MEHFSGKVAAITGAASGIGRALAEALVAEGAAVALCDVDEVGLAETVARCEGRGVKVAGTVVDVADRDAVHDWADRVAEDFGAVHLVVNNAGVALGATVESMSYEDLEWLMGINFWGVVHGTKAFLPHLRAAGEGHVVNISSVFGLVSVPSQSAYNAAKFGVRGFTEALRVELEIEDAPVSASVVHPGGIRTNIVRNARIDSSATELSGGDEADAHAEFDRMARTTPASAARQILDGVRKDKRRILVGADARVIDVVSRLPFGLSHRILVRSAKRGRR
ncbi:MAG: SDR family NAD(P)-dependent oxidoreductase [Actinomycetota bacterium]